MSRTVRRYNRKPYRADGWFENYKWQNSEAPWKQESRPRRAARRKWKAEEKAKRKAMYRQRISRVLVKWYL
jgi:hypothetical protein